VSAQVIRDGSAIRVVVTNESGDVGPEVAGLLAGRDRRPITDFLTSDQIAACRTATPPILTDRIGNALLAAQAGGWVLDTLDLNLRIDQYLRLGGGSLHWTGRGRVLFDSTDGIEYAPTFGQSRNVVSQTTVDFPYANQRLTRLVLTSVAGYAAGDWLHVYCSENYLAAEADTTRRAELARIYSVDPTTSSVLLSVLLGEDYTVSYNGGAVQSSVVKLATDRQLVVDGLSFGQADYDGSDAMRPVRGALIATGCVQPFIRADFRGIAGRGAVLLACADGDAIVTGDSLKDDATAGFYGYAATAMGSSRWCRFDVNASRCRHPFTTNVYSRNGAGQLLWDSGGPRETEVTGTAYNATSAAWDTHPGAFDTRFHNIRAFWTHQVADDDVAEQGRQFAVQDRGCGTVIDGLYSVGGHNGLALFGQSFEYRRTNETFARNVLCRNMSGDNSRTAVRQLPRFRGAAEDAFRKRVYVHGTFRRFQAMDVPAGNAPITFSGRHERQRSYYFGTNSTVNLSHFERISIPGDNDEAVRIANGGIVRAFKCHFEGPVAEGALFHGFGTGSGTLVYEGLSSFSEATTLVRSVADPGFTLTEISAAR
jgi:hypothetical protein